MMNAGLDLPSGFRFHPTDEEIITSYLVPKVLHRDFTSNIIGVVDLNRTEPWDLPDKAMLGHNEWYFFNLKDRKYPTGMRINRATEAGYWKATGKDKEIYRGEELIGMKKTLVFYEGRAPKGGKTSWVMHEYRLHGNSKLQGHASGSDHSSSAAAMQSDTSSGESMEQWVVCRVFHKTPVVKKEPVPTFHMAMAGGDGGADQNRFAMPMPMQFPMPPPMDFSIDTFFSSGGGNSSFPMPPPPLPPMMGMGGMFGNAMAPPALQPMPAFYSQMGMGGAGAGGGFMQTPESSPLSMVLQQGMSPNQQATNNAADISSIVPSTLAGPMDDWTRL